MDPLALAMVAGIATLRGGLRGTAWRVAAGRLAVLAVATMIVSASWLVVVDAIPASSRPYIGGSTDNTVLDLVLGYNGIGRIEGGSGQPGGGARPPFAAPNGNNAPGGFGGFTPPQGIRPQQGAPGAPQAAPGGGAGGPGGAGARGAGGIIAGTPGPLRMFDEANGGQIAWFLPFALIGGGVALGQWRRDPLRRASAVLWLGWVVLFAGVFSYAQGIYHSYYTSALAPGIAALVGIGGVAIVEAIRAHDWRARALGVLGDTAAVGATLGVQLLIAGRVPTYFGWMRPATIVVAVAGLALLAVAAFIRGRAWPRWPSLARLDTHRLGLAGIATSACGLVLLPAAWSLSLTTQAAPNTTLPQAGPQRGASAMTFGSQAFDSGTDALAAWLLAHREPGATWDLVTSSSQSGSTLIAKHSVSVLSLGGFSGNDPAITVAGFADLVRDGRVRYVLTTQNGPGGVRGAPGMTPGGAAPGGTVPGGAAPGGIPGGFGRDGRTRPGGVIPGGTQQAPTMPSTAPGTTSPPRTPATSATSATPATGGAFGGAAFGRGGGVISAVQQSCTAVTDASLPAQYRGAIYDCSNAASALASRAVR